METAIEEQRKDVRTDLTWPVSVWIPNAFGFFNGRIINVSRGGIYISVPIITLVIVGEQVEINFPRTAVLAKRKGQYARLKSGKVLRVERKMLLEEPATYIAVQFDE